MATKLLTDRHVRNARPRPKPYRLFDGDGLALWVSPSGAKSWQLRYRLGDKEQTATLGKVDRLTLADARIEAEKARKLVTKGEHPTAVKHAVKAQLRADAANTFEAFAAEWIKREARRAGWTADYRAEVAASLRKHLSELNALPMTKITAAVAAPSLLAIERVAPNMHEKVRQRLRAILDDAAEQGIIPGNPLPAVRRRKRHRRHYPAMTAPADIGALLRAARASDPCKGIQRAHLLLAFTAMRVSEIVNATWDEFDLPAATWSIPRERMKRKDSERGPHDVPIPPVLLAALREWHEADSAEAIYVCPAPRDAARPITPEGIEQHYRKVLALNGKHSPHSWRSAFKTICADAGKDTEVIEAQLDHVVGNKVASAYDRAKRLQLRRDLLAWYEQKLIAARDGADVLPMTTRK